MAISLQEQEQIKLGLLDEPELAAASTLLGIAVLVGTLLSDPGPSFAALTAGVLAGAVVGLLHSWRRRRRRRMVVERRDASEGGRKSKRPDWLGWIEVALVLFAIFGLRGLHAGGVVSGMDILGLFATGAIVNGPLDWLDLRRLAADAG